MGCTQSKIENEEAVARCKARKQLMKEAVSSRNAFAAAHSSYAMYLKNTGAALSDYAQGEVQNPQLLAHIPVQPNSSSTAAAAAPAQFAETLPPPPPPPANFPNSVPLQRAATMPEIKLPKQDPPPRPNPILEEDDEDEEEEEGSMSLRRKRSSNRSGGGSREVQESGGSNRGPQPPPVSLENRTIPPSYQPSQQDSYSYDYFFNVETMPRSSTLSEVEEVNISKEEIDPNMFDERSNRVDEEEEVKSSSKVEVEPVVEKAAAVAVAEPPPPPPPDPEAAAAAVAAVGAVKSLKKAKQASSGAAEGKRKGNNLLQIFVDLDDHFLKASESAHEVSKMLEATRLHYHSNFADNRGHIDHSARVMRVITWNRSFRGLANNDDVNDDFDSEEHETHATVLDKLLAWEKKLYDEVKAGEVMKFEYQRKVNALNRLKKRGTNSDALEKAKATVSHLHTRYIVDMQSMDSTVSEINRLRDEQLYPKLVQLVDGMATMWETMRYHHELQLKIVQALRYLDISQCPKETSEHHHDRTVQLYAVVNEWHLQFEKLVHKQKDYIKALNMWLKLNLIPTESSLKEKVSSPPRQQSPPIQKLLLAWQDHLEKIPDELARSAISNFAAVIDTIVHQQQEEMMLREKCENTEKELSRKKRQFEDWYRKYMQQRLPNDGEPAEDTGSNDAIVEKQIVIDSLKKRLEEDQEAYQRHCLHVREKSLTSLKTRLPELFRALSDFTVACSEMYMDLRSRPMPQHRHESSA